MKSESFVLLFLLLFFKYKSQVPRATEARALLNEVVVCGHWDAASGAHENKSGRQRLTLDFMLKILIIGEACSRKLVLYYKICI